MESLMAGIHSLDVAALLLYAGGVTVAGLYFSSRNKTTDAYFLGGRNFPSWAIGLSMVGTSISSVSFLAYPADAFKTAWLRMVPNFALPLAVLIASIWILPFFRRKNTISAFQYLESRYGPSTRIYGAIAFIISQAVRTSLILYLVSLLAQEFTGWPLWMCILMGGLFVSFYTIVGGIEAVIWTDVVQTIVLMAGGVACLCVIVSELPGGFSQIISEAREAGKFQFAEFVETTGEFRPASWDFTFFRKTAFMMLLVGLVNWLTEYSANQNVVQRYCASRSTRDARKAMWICCGASIPIWAFFMFLGTALWVFFREFPSPETTAMLSGHAKPEGVLPFFILSYLPPGLAGLVIAAALAAAMSSLDSSINAIATVSIVDIYRRHLVKNYDDRHYVTAAKSVAAGASIIMIVGALLLAQYPGKTMQDTATILVAITAGGLLGLYMLGFLTTMGDGRTVGVAIVCTLMFTTYRALEGFEWVPRMPIDPYYTGIAGHMLMFGVGFAMGSIVSKRKRDLTGLTLWTQDSASVD